MLSTVDGAVLLKHAMCRCFIHRRCPLLTPLHFFLHQVQYMYIVALTSDSHVCVPVAIIVSIVVNVTIMNINILLAEKGPLGPIDCWIRH